MKTALINQILELKTAATGAGFDFPNEDPENATFEELEQFLAELELFLRRAK